MFDQRPLAFEDDHDGRAESHRLMGLARLPLVGVTGQKYEVEGPRGHAYSSFEHDEHLPSRGVVPAPGIAVRITAESGKISMPPKNSVAMFSESQIRTATLSIEQGKPTTQFQKI